MNHHQHWVASYGLKLLELVPGLARAAAFDAAESAWEIHSQQFPADAPAEGDSDAAAAAARELRRTGS